MQQTVTTLQGERVLLRPFQEGDAEESARVWTPESTYICLAEAAARACCARASRLMANGTTTS
jgi:hypothetical protein